MKPTTCKLCSAAAVVVLAAMGIVWGQVRIEVRADVKPAEAKPAKKPAGPFEAFAALSALFAAAGGPSRRVAAVVLDLAFHVRIGR